MYRLKPKSKTEILAELIRRSSPKMIAFDVIGVQPMNPPTGLIFTMKSKYGKTET